MKRRTFLELGSTMSLTPFFLSQNLLVKPFFENKFIPPSVCDLFHDRILILVQLRGGNDGVNTVVPITQYDTYATLRPNTRLAQADLLQLDSSLNSEKQIGLHPSMIGFKTLYEQGQLNIVHSVGYPTQPLSHFKSTNLMLAGDDGTKSDRALTDGWLARYLTAVYPSLAGEPTANFQDPLGIQIGQAKSSLGFHHDHEHGVSINLANQRPDGFYDVLSQLGGVTASQFPNGEYGDLLQYISNQVKSTNKYVERLSTLYNKGNTIETYPDTYLASQFRTVAKLISGGSRSKIYLLDMTGFDTHVNQVVEHNSKAGQHSELLMQLSQAVFHFQNDLKHLNLEDKVVTMTFSEFGRRPKENGNLGTDHGTIAPMFVIGKGVEPGVTGVNPNLTRVNAKGFFEESYQFDYRQAFVTTLQDWLGANSATLKKVYFDSFESQKIDLFKAEDVVPEQCRVSALLPIKLVEFLATPSNDFVQLNWAVSSEKDVRHYEILRSKDGLNFESILKEDALGQQGEIRYGVIDEQPLPGISYYQLKSVDLNGKQQYSNIVKVEMVYQKFELIAYPNPFRNILNIDAYMQESGRVDLSILNVSGQLVYKTSKNMYRGKNTIPLHLKTLSVGTYTIRADVFNHKVLIESIVKNIIKT